MEIKFRAWDVERGEYVFFSLSSVINGDSSKLCDVDLESVEQFTNLKDKNGKEIYEGDVVKDGWSGENGTVSFESGFFYLGFGYLENISTQSEDCEVIGNTHQSPSP